LDFTLPSPHYRVKTASASLQLPDRAVFGTLIVAIPMRDVDDTLHHLLLIELLVAAGVLFALALLSWWVVHMGLRPLEQMGETAGAIAGGDLSRRVEPADEKTEVGRLGLALNSMLGQIETAFAERTASETRLRRFVADASHELRTPLTSIRGYAELFRRGASTRPDDLAKTMRRIEEAAARMGVLVDDLLLLARLDQGRPLEHGPVDLTRLVAAAVDDLRASSPDRPVTYEATGPVVVNGDEFRLRQVLANLLENARTHTPPTTPVEVRVTQAGDDAIVEVRDHGPGMNEQDAARAFERFWRSDPSRTRSSGGAGLGLAIVAAITEAHGGHAEVETAPGEGATFRVYIPFTPPTPRPEPEAPPGFELLPEVQPEST
jgi:two-component system OmpR family sensor kinase